MKKMLISLSVISLISVTILVFILSIDRNKVEIKPDAIPQALDFGLRKSKL